MNDLAIILNLFDEENTLTYRPELARRFGSVTAGILYQQMLYWWKKSKLKPFYKFKQPCSHPKYKEGDSWCEELAFSRREFDNALKVIGQKLSKGASKNPDAHVYYWTDMERVTKYQINPEAFRKVVIELYGSDEQKEALRKAENALYVKAESDFTKSSDPALYNTETTPETIVQSSSLPPARKISRTDSGSIDVASLKPSEPTTAEKNPPVPAAPPSDSPPPPYQPGETPEAYIVRMTDPGPNSIEMDRWKVKHGLTYERIREEIEVFGDKYILYQFPEGPPHNLAEIVQGRHGIFMRLFRSSFLPKIKSNPVTSNHQPHAKSQQPRNSEPSRRKSQRELLADLYPDVAAELYGDLASGVDGRNPEPASHAHWREA